MVDKQINGKLPHFNSVILLDTGTTLKATIMDPNPVTNTIMIRNPVEMMTNVGGGG